LIKAKVPNRRPVNQELGTGDDDFFPGLQAAIDGIVVTDSVSDPSAFSTSQNREGIQLGTAIATLVRNRTAAQRAGALHVRDLWGTGKLKQLELKSRSEDEPEYSSLIPVDALGDLFAHRTHSTTYLTWPLLADLFPESFPGVQSGRDDLVTDISREHLEERMRNYLNPKFSHEEMDAVVPGTMIVTKRFRAIEVRRCPPERGFRPWQIMPLAHRPYDKRWLYWEPTTKLLDEKREEYLGQYRTDVPVMYLAQKNRKAFDPPGITYLLANRHLNERGANAFPLSTMGETLPGHLESLTNVSDAASRYLDEVKTERSSLFLSFPGNHARTAIPDRKFRCPHE
jgi:hypothetical protein